MQIQPLTPNINYSKTNFAAANKMRAGKRVSFSMVKGASNSAELENFVSELKNIKYDLLIKLLPYTSKSAETNKNAAMLTKKLDDVNSILHVLAPLPQNTLRRTV